VCSLRIQGAVQTPANLTIKKKTISTSTGVTGNLADSLKTTVREVGSLRNGAAQSHCCYGLAKATGGVGVGVGSFSLGKRGKSCADFAEREAMTIQLTCNCGNQIQVDDAMAGRRGKCRDCGNILLIPAATPTPRPPQATTPNAAAREIAEETTKALGWIAAAAVWLVAGAVAANVSVVGVPIGLLLVGAGVAYLASPKIQKKTDDAIGKRFGKLRGPAVLCTVVGCLCLLGAVIREPDGNQPPRGASTDRKGDPKTAKCLTLDLGSGVTMKLIRIEAGRFTMGSSERSLSASPVRQVTISNPFHMGIMEVTQAQWKALMNTQPWKGLSDVLEV